MSKNEQVLKICSKYKIEVLLLHFNINRKGDHYKICKKMPSASK